MMEAVFLSETQLALREISAPSPASKIYFATYTVVRISRHLSTVAHATNNAHSSSAALWTPALPHVRRPNPHLPPPPRP